MCKEKANTKKEISQKSRCVRKPIWVCDFHSSVESLFWRHRRGGRREYETKLSRQKRKIYLYLPASKMYLLKPFNLAVTESAFWRLPVALKDFRVEVLHWLSNRVVFLLIVLWFFSPVVSEVSHWLLYLKIQNTVAL